MSAITKKRLPLWKDRYHEACALISQQGGTLVLSAEEWAGKCTNSKFCPPIRCNVHEDVVMSSARLNNLCNGQRVACWKCNPALNKWVNRYEDARALIFENGGELLLTKAEWSERCTNASFCPPIRCIKHGVVVSRAVIGGLHEPDQGIGCFKCNPKLNHWVDRYEEIKGIVCGLNCELLLTESEWKAQCTGEFFTPPIKCLEHGEVVRTSRLNSLQSGRGVGCPKCINKTEKKLLEWLQLRHQDVEAQRPKFKRLSTGGILRFDMSSPSEKWIIELDGVIPGGHFDRTCNCPQRDLEKEQWARAHGYQVIRVLQQHVWRNRKNWDDYLSTQIAAWNGRRIQGLSPGEAITPQEPEYREGIYAELRRSQHR